MDSQSDSEIRHLGQGSMWLSSIGKNRGTYIINTPSARENIHEYCRNIMGQYGVNNFQDKIYRVNTSQNNEHERDEVDNAISKMQKISPLLLRKKKKFRSNSYSEDDENAEDNYSSNVLSKSLPSTLSTHLYSSDDSQPAVIYPAVYTVNSRFEESYTAESFNISNQSSNSPRRLQRELSVPSTPLSSKIQASNKSSKITICLSIVVLLIAVIYYQDPTILKSLPMEVINHYKSTKTENSGVKLFENNMDNLQEKYNIDNDLILKLKTGISTIFLKSDTASFMFVYNSKKGNFDPSQFDKFINEVAYTAARYLRNDISSIQHTVILSSNLDMQEHGELINKYKHEVDKTGVLLVKEVDSVPSQLAMAFHYYCDEYNPLIKRSAIFFTLNLANCSNTADKSSSHDFVEKCLAGKWKALPPENIRPLLTRVVDSIIDVTSVF